MQSDEYAKLMNDVQHFVDCPGMCLRMRACARAFVRGACVCCVDAVLIMIDIMPPSPGACGNIGMQPCFVAAEIK